MAGPRTTWPGPTASGRTACGRSPPSTHRTGWSSWTASPTNTASHSPAPSRPASSSPSSAVGPRARMTTVSTFASPEQLQQALEMGAEEGMRLALDQIDGLLPASHAEPPLKPEGQRGMRKLIATTFLTLDGVMQAPGGPGEDDDNGFPHGGWSVTYWDDMMGQTMAEATSKPFAMVLGRRTYDIMAAFWPTASEEDGANLQQRHQVRRVARPPHPGVGQLGADRGGRCRRTGRAQAAGRAGASGARQRGPAPVAVAAATSSTSSGCGSSRSSSGRASGCSATAPPRPD